VRIAKFIDNVHVYNTKAKPKRIAIIDSNGQQVQFILKLEKKTDLRKDSRMMDFVNVINGEIGSKRVIETSMRTYQVLTLAEDTGLIEFVPNLVTIRKIIDESLVRIGKSVSQYLNKEVMSKLAHKTDGFPYYRSIVETIPPMLAEWFGKEFSNPRAWLRARNTFTQTQALWCIVGHVVGLGDRHPDNILIDTQSGAVVHVDFDCIFSRGMILNIPELVPFRLTPICVSGMGVTGVEGLFRSTSEHIMRLLRERRKMLLSVLHAFIADPLIDWQAGANTSKKAKDVVQAIEKKLNGFVDVGEIRPDPNVNEEKLIVFNEGSEKNSGLGKDRGASLSVEGQIDELIRAAVCPRNLAKMYLGWMPLF
jgi:serine/threonine-protein kinase ATR